MAPVRPKQGSESLVVYACSAEDATSTASPPSHDGTNTDSEHGEDVNCVDKEVHFPRQCMTSGVHQLQEALKRADKINRGQGRALAAMQQELQFAASWAEQVLAKATAREAELEAANATIRRLQQREVEPAMAAEVAIHASSNVSELQRELASCQQQQQAKEQALNSTVSQQAAQLRDLKEQLKCTRKELQNCKAHSDGQQRSLKKELQAVTEELQTCRAELGEPSRAKARPSQKVAQSSEDADTMNTIAEKREAPAQKGRRFPGSRDLDRAVAVQRLGELRKSRSSSASSLPCAIAIAIVIQALALFLWYSS